jgi:hypothetical protein
MVYQRRQIITESERNRILGLYERPMSMESVVIAEWLSPDEKFCIFLDDLIDVENKVKIGNIWENFDHFKFFLNHSFEVAANVSQEIKESVMESLKSFVITESNQDMSGLKPYVKELLKENVFGDAWDYAKETGSKAVQGVKDFTSKSWEGVKSLYKDISEGEWVKAFELIKKGMLYVARTIRSAIYNPIGILLDAILIATGVGKGAQFVVWAIIVGLDIYELTTGDVEDKDLTLPWRLLFLGVDIIGLVFAGVAAKAAKGVVGSAVRQFGSSLEGFSKALKSNKVLQGIAQKILDATKGASGLISKALSNLKTSSPKIFSFISTPLNAIGSFITKIVEVLSSGLKGTVKVGNKVLSAPGNAVKSALGNGGAGNLAKTMVNVGTPLVAAGVYSKNKEREAYKEVGDALQGSNVKANYDSDKIEW